MWAARSGRIAAVLGGPPQNTFMLRRCTKPGPEALRSNDFPYGGWYGQSAKDLALVNRHTGLFSRMVYLHALATAGRCKNPADAQDVKEVGSCWSNRRIHEVIWTFKIRWQLILSVSGVPHSGKVTEKKQVWRRILSI